MSDPSLERLANATLLAPFPGATPPRWVLEGLERGMSGVTLFAINGNVPGTRELAELTAALRGHADPLISIDEEGGDVTRLAHDTGSPYPGSAALGAVDDPAVTRRVHRSLGAELREVGVNLDFAPSADVNTADDNPIIGTRAFGSDPEIVARHVAAAVAGLQEAGVAACAKHFPGHGATSQDSHLEIPTVDADMALLERRELVPFRAAIEAGVASIMTGHLRVPALTGDTPATLSHAAVTGLLRGALGYTGPVVTDALDMRAASDAIGIPEASVRALLAGSDLLCLGSKEFEDSVRAIREHIVEAVRQGRLPGERLEEAAARVAGLKAWLATAGSSEIDRAAGLEAARRAVRVTGAPRSPRTPSSSRSRRRRTSRSGRSHGVSAPGRRTWCPWRPATPTPVVSWNVPTDARSSSSSGTRTGTPGTARCSTLLTARPDAVLVEMGLPVWRPEGVAYVATYGATRADARAAAEVIGLLEPVSGDARA